jgi:hypothetical protein
MQNLIVNTKSQRMLWFGYFTAVLLWGIRSYAFLLESLRNNELFVSEKQGWVLDFVSWYNAALVAASAQKAPLAIYDHAVQLESMKRLLSPFVPKDDYYLDYPPQFFAFVRPLAGMGLERAWIFWCSLATIPIGFALWQLSKNLEGKFSRAMYIVGCCASYPCWFSFNEGQTSLFQFPAHAAFWLLLRSESHFLAGLLTGFIVIKLQYAPLIVLVGLILGRLKFLFGLIISSSVFLLATLYVVGWDNIISYPSSLLYGESLQTTGAVIMQNFRGQALLLLGGDSKFVHYLSIFVYILTLAAVAYVWSALYPKLKTKFGRHGFDICAAFSVACMLSASLHTHIPDYLFAAILVAFLYPIANRLMGKRLSLLTKFLLVGFPVYSWFALFTMSVGIWVMLRMQPFAVWAMALLIVCVVQIRRMLGVPLEEAEGTAKEAIG